MSILITWNGYQERVFTRSPIRCAGNIAWIDGLPYPYTSIDMVRIP